MLLPLRLTDDLGLAKILSSTANSHHREMSGWSHTVMFLDHTPGDYYDT